MREHRVDVGGRTLCVAEAGDPEGRTVFSLHGTPGARLFWHEVFEDAEQRRIRLVAYDRPGYGGSDAAPGRSGPSRPRNRCSTSNERTIAATSTRSSSR